MGYLRKNTQQEVLHLSSLVFIKKKYFAFTYDLESPNE